ncbi:hypothetical protein OPV22_031346 [Ensete ventricosum]|uniref:4-coumarate--CoA ligase n=1 Tax=Ensete ventricosum TaxID=4639 RepID=A0AAV8PM38_ENSVE|nr:hypothetical protein OPV22_031346 [Ensete ventricosum]
MGEWIAVVPRLPSWPPSLDHCSGFDASTRTFHSLRPPVPLPPMSRPFSFASFIASLLPSPFPAKPTVAALTFPDLFSQVRSLAAALCSEAGLAKGHVALVLAPTSLDIPPLYLALLSLGAVVSPANPASTPSELPRLVELSRPRLAFAISATAAKLPRHITTILLDSPRFRSFLSGGGGDTVALEEVLQSDVAAIQYSSGTTGTVKAAALSHRSFIAMVAGFHACQQPRPVGAEVSLLGAPLFHSMGFFFMLNGVALGDTTVVMGGGGGVTEILRAAERYRATQLSVSPPVVVAMARWAERIDLGALEQVICGGAMLHEATVEQFIARFPDVKLCQISIDFDDAHQAYGSTEAGGISRMIGPDECRRLRSVGRLSQDVEAKIVDTVTGQPLSIGQAGELWIRGPACMIGYVGDEEANGRAFDSSGWLKTGDLCYFDRDGFLFVMDRLKELIKYKAYQVPPAELEHLLQSLPGVADAAVVPYPDAEAGQIPVAEGSSIQEDSLSCVHGLYSQNS